MAHFVYHFKVYWKMLDIKQGC